MEIIIKEQRLSKCEYIEFLTRSDLGLQYPKERFDERIEKLVNNATISLVAYNNDAKVVGVLLGLTDFAYWLYITDLGVDRDYQSMGIGKRLMLQAMNIAGGDQDIAMYLVANDKAMGFYEKLGMQRANDVMQYNKIEWTPFKVQ